MVIKELMDPKRHILALASGILGGAIPNQKSNIHPFLLGAIFALLIVKLVYGDYDWGFQFSWTDILFVMVIGLEGAAGAWIISEKV
jgi:hypothetical protein